MGYRRISKYYPGCDGTLLAVDLYLPETREKVPVLFNAAIRGGNLRDPWGTPYQYMIADAGNATESGADQVGSGLSTYMYLPNLWRLKADEQE